ncbi:DUF5050 domain-containing protein [Acidaminobacter sp. JC074]|uniref:DUF5050 domain-containing protein n=1 Tax=Acidaminobacter sp. JC074 TaxID=2530199 RepID=UPI001F0E5358|nr:DUF5050 domain-containing protein [Acidaminobacter sp. JC074]
MLLLPSTGLLDDWTIFSEVGDKIYETKLENVEKIDISTNGKLGNTLANINTGGFAVESDDYYYYLKDGLILCRSEKDFSNEEIIIENASGHGMWHLNTVDDYLVFLRENLVRYKLVDNKSTELPLQKYMIDLHIKDEWLYFIRLYKSDQAICRMTLNGENLQVLSDVDASDIAISGDKIYYSYEFDGRGYLDTMNLDGTDKTTLSNVKTRDMIIEDDEIFYLSDDFKLSRLNEDGTVDILSNEKISHYCKVDQFFYFTKFGDGKYNENEGLYKMDLKDQNILQLSYGRLEEGISVLGDWVLYRSSDDNMYPTLKRVSILTDEIIPMD